MLSEYGRVIECVTDKYGPKSAFPGVLTGVRVARMQLRRHVPNYLRVCNLEVYVEYVGQPRTCQRCGSTQHLRAACPRVNTYASRLAASKGADTPQFVNGKAFEFEGETDNEEEAREGEAREEEQRDEEQGGGEQRIPIDHEFNTRMFNMRMELARKNNSWMLNCKPSAANKGKKASPVIPTALVAPAAPAAPEAPAPPAVPAAASSSETEGDEQPKELCVSNVSVDLVIASINICAATARAKLDNLQDALRGVDVALLQEVAAPVLGLNGYREYANPGPRGRGTAILVKENLQSTLLLALLCGRGTAVKCSAPTRTAALAADIRETKKEILAVHAQLLTGFKERAQLQGALRDEPLSAIHVGQAARRARQRRIEKLKDDSGRTLQDPGDIQDEFFNFYKAKFQDEESAISMPSRILEALESTVSEEDNAALNRPITSEEVLLAVRRSPKRKSPGQDGITAEFYAAAWTVIGESLTEVMNDMWQRQLVPGEMTKGTITLIPKIAAPRRIKDFRPITLLDVDAKVLARVMTSRLSELQDKLLHANQVRPRGERTMSVALCDIRDALSALGAQRTAGCIASIDFSGAFDAVRHEFLFEVLRRRGLSGNVVGVLKSMYGGATSRIRVNGVLTLSFPVERSVRQGCPASMFLFAVILAPLMILLDRRLQGLALASSCLRVSSYADDAFFLLRSPDEAAVVRGALDDFGVASGLLANPAKCGALATATWNRDINIGFNYQMKLKILGVDFYADVRTTTRTNWEKVVGSVRAVLRDNAARALGMHQRALYVQMYGLSKAWHVAQVLPINRAVARDITAAARRFLWRGHFFTSPMDVCATPLRSGGLGIPDILRKCTALFVGRWQGARTVVGDSITAAWLTTLLEKHPQGEQLRRVSAQAPHFRAYHTTMTTTAGAADAAPRDIIRALYEDLTRAAPPPVPRVVEKAPAANWEVIWQNIRSQVIHVDAQESWWLVAHDLVATRHRLHRCNRAPSRMCPHCNVPDVLLHRLTSCREARSIWSWVRTILTRTLRVRPSPNILLQPDFVAGAEDMQAAALWACATAVHYTIRTNTPNAHEFAAQVHKSRKKVLDDPERWPPALITGLLAWVK
ncbi:hypothetical protein FOCC_FOCC016953 [Frankliniella occidentalis]|nr:hypothetical protein FOCC_FOCC016953 [Frankliniella occidentalis]